jgi:hypothetical protein
MHKSVQNMKPLRIFYSYSKQDQELLDRLLSHMRVLERVGLIEEWSNTAIQPGDDRNLTTEKYLRNADIILLLISANFINTDFCYEVELSLALQEHQRGKALVIPIFLRPCSWQDTPIAQLQGLPRNNQSITSHPYWSDQDEAFYEIVQELKLLIRKLK